MEKMVPTRVANLINSPAQMFQAAEWNDQKF